MALREHQKYLITPSGEAVIFPAALSHKRLCQALELEPGSLLGAGYVSFSPPVTCGLDINCFGRSRSLRLTSRGGIDADCIAREMRV
ncbi:hypothetical protein J2T57_001427 [Natronocella acetinitrilica]|uniref:Uncharacterized protein n=1 Tax=Natronocella acetinitrilica TaxID=414046 RepID=A0AAE3G260_9GAMM|nr:hypothetical protein [Natronocella acetinitrilica]MCP1674325.1 hypothetical protein [Natronocella acetinitrilica]